MNNDRGVIKWMPFNSIVEEQKLIEQLVKDKNKITKPNLSQEQIQKNEEKLIEAFYEKIKVTIEYFQAGDLLKITSKILKIDTISQKIYLEKQQILFFKQIIKIIML